MNAKWNMECDGPPEWEEEVGLTFSPSLLPPTGKVGSTITIVIDTSSECIFVTC